MATEQSPLHVVKCTDWRVEASGPDDDNLCWLVITSPSGKSAAFSAPADDIIGQVVAEFARAQRA